MSLPLRGLFRTRYLWLWIASISSRNPPPLSGPPSTVQRDHSIHFASQQEYTTGQQWPSLQGRKVKGRVAHGNSLKDSHVTRKALHPGTTKTAISSLPLFLFSCSFFLTPFLPILFLFLFFLLALLVPFCYFSVRHTLIETWGGGGSARLGRIWACLLGGRSSTATVGA